MHGSDELLRALFAARVDRRGFLKSSAAGVVLLGAGSLVPAGCKSYPKPPAALRFFTGTEYAIINAAAERLLGVAGKVGAGAGQIDVAAHVDAFVAQWDADAQGQLRMMLRVFEHGTYLFDLQRQRFTRLAPAQQDIYLDGCMNSTLGARRMVFRALKGLAAAGFYQDRRVWPTIGYDGPWLGRVYATAGSAPEPVAPLSALLARGQ
jgi:hypothetical protein